MALYEYECQQCGEKFEFWSRFSQLNREIRCPHCGDHNPKRVYCVSTPRSEDPAAVTESC